MRAPHPHPKGGEGTEKRSPGGRPVTQIDADRPSRHAEGRGCRAAPGSRPAPSIRAAGGRFLPGSGVRRYRARHVSISSRAACRSSARRGRADCPPRQASPRPAGAGRDARTAPRGRSTRGCGEGRGASGAVPVDLGPQQPGGAAPRTSRPDWRYIRAARTARSSRPSATSRPGANSSPSTGDTRSGRGSPCPIPRASTGTPSPCGTTPGRSTAGRSCSRSSTSSPGTSGSASARPGRCSRTMPSPIPRSSRSAATTCARSSATCGCSRRCFASSTSTEWSWPRPARGWAGCTGSSPACRVRCWRPRPSSPS